MNYLFFLCCGLLACLSTLIIPTTFWRILILVCIGLPLVVAPILLFIRDYIIRRGVFQEEK